MNSGKKSVSLVGAIAIGIGGMVGGGIFAVLGEAVSIAHGATVLSFLIAGIIALLTSFAYAKLSIAYKNRGGTVMFIDKAFGNNLTSGSLNLMLWLSYLVTIALYAVAFASYAQNFFANNNSIILKHVLISAAILIPTAFNLVSASFVSKSETIIVGLKIILLIIIIAFSIPYIRYERNSPAHWGSLVSVAASGMIIFVAYEGFELIANTSEDIINPKRNLPLAFFISVLSVIVLYMLIAIVTVGTVSEKQILIAKDYALAEASLPALGQFGFFLVSIAALLATFSAINATIYGNARLGYFLAKDGELPQTFDKQAWDEPIVGIIITATVSLLIANTINLTEIAIIGSASFLLIFALINASAIKLKREIGGKAYLYIIAFLLCVAAILTLLLETYQNNFKAILVFLSFLGISLIFEVTYGKYIRGHFLGRK